MPEFKNNEEYEKWKAEKVKAGKENQNNPPQEIPVRTTNVKQSSAIKKAIVWTLATIVLLAVGYFGYQYYAGYKQKKDLRIIIQKFKELGSALSVGLNKHDYNKRLINIKIEIDKFKDTHKNLSEQHTEIINLIEKAFQTYSFDGEEAWGGVDEIALTNWKGDYFSWAENWLQKYPLLKNKIIRHNFYIDKSSEIHDAFHDILTEKEMERFINIRHNENIDIQMMNARERFRVPQDKAVGATTVKQMEVAETKNSHVSTYIIQELSRSDFKDIVWSYAADYIKDAESLL